MIKPYDILNDTWEVSKKVGQGTFCQLFVGRNVTGEYADEDVNAQVAIKVSSESVDSSVLKWEAEVLKDLLGSQYVPQYVFMGSSDQREYLVMEYLSAEDMSQLRNRIRATSGSGLVSLAAASYLARQMLRGIHALHQKGYIHRDIKPANFVRKNKDSTEFCIIDFGISKQYRDKDGRIRKCRDHAEMRGTTTYASLNMHRGEDHCPRDDIYSLLLVFFDLVCGRLPWTEQSRSKDKAAVTALKEQYLSNPQSFIHWVTETVDATEKAHAETRLGYDPNFPEIAQQHTLAIFEHVHKLQYYDTPDYEFIENSLLAAVENPSRHDVSDIAYKANGFQWDPPGLEKPQFRRENSQSMPPADHAVQLLRVRLRYITNHLSNPAVGSADGNSMDIEHKNNLFLKSVFR